MTIQLDKILEDISAEKSLYVRESAPADEEQAAWGRVGAKNKLSGVEIRAIFKVLQKKYAQEKEKPASSWKLFDMMRKISEKDEIKEETADEEEEEENMEDEAFIELLEVREDEDETDDENDKSANSSNASISKNEALEKSVTSSKSVSPKSKPTPAKKDVKILNNQIALKTSDEPVKPMEVSSQSKPKATLRSSSVVSQKTPPIIPISISQRKSIGPKTGTISTPQPPVKKVLTANQSVETRRVLNQEALKRKLPEGKKDDIMPVPAKRQAIKAPPIGSVVNTGTLAPSSVSVVSVIPCPTSHTQSTNSKTALIDEQTKFINGTIAANTSPNGGGSYANRIRTDPNINGLESDSITMDIKKEEISNQELTNFGNFDNNLPPHFFKNLCNSQRHEALGLYVANVLNRCTARSAKKLELSILKSIIEFQSEEIDN